ncbi:MAG: exo-alpha-sialidase [Thermoleophilaceae bacterium]|nr:exo-alpha-sialidase [Thermoleophilaceae bacterium]
MATQQEKRETRRLQRVERERAALAAERRKKLRGYAVAAVLGVAAVAAVAVVAVGDGGDSGAGQVAAEGRGGGHVHGLGVNPADGAVFVASHNGLFRAAPGDTQAHLVGTTGKDVMGFSIVGPNRFLGSGHPGAGEDLPPSLGLILSTDAGRTFRPVSLLGEADFHVLRASGSRVYGFDGSSGRFLASGDGGRSWTELPDPPGTLVDLTIDPRDPDRLIASTDSGLSASSDVGRSWRRLGEQIALVAWAAPERLFILDAEGEVAMSLDGGRRFRPTGRVPGEPVSFMAAGNDLYVALSDNRVMRSSDGGASWSLRTQV